MYRMTMAAALLTLAYALAGCSAFSAPNTLVEYHNRTSADWQIEKWSRGDANGVAGRHTQPVWDNR